MLDLVVIDARSTLIHTPSHAEEGEIACAAYEAPLANPASALARLRGRVVTEVIAHLVPPAILFARGARDDAQKRVALTFDDGPDAMTARYLDALDALGVPATFFFVGENAERAPGTVRECVRRGHEVGGHGWTHTEFSALEPAALASELARTNALFGAEGCSSTIVRPPRGALSGRALWQVATSGLATVLWSLDSDDCRTRAPEQVARRLHPSRIRAGEVILLHESQPWTLRALEPAVRTLRASGYRFATVTELMRR